MQRALVAASIVALVLMIVFAIVINIQPNSPLPSGVVNNSVQEQAPFGPAHSAAPQVPPPVVHAAAPARQPTVATAPAKPPAAVTRRPAIHRSRRSNDDVAQDEVIVHHYGAPKRPSSTQTRAGIARYSDQE